jgi:hypothetical protein
MWTSTNLMFGQWGKLFIMLKYSSLQSFNIFGPQQGIGFKFTMLSWFWKPEKSLRWPGAHMSVAHYLSTGTPGTQGHSHPPFGESPSVSAAPRGWAGLSLHWRLVGGCSAPISAPRSRLRLWSTLHYPLVCSSSPAAARSPRCHPSHPWASPSHPSALLANRTPQAAEPPVVLLRESSPSTAAYYHPLVVWHP